MKLAIWQFKSDEFRKLFVHEIGQNEHSWRQWYKIANDKSYRIIPHCLLFVGFKRYLDRYRADIYELLSIWILCLFQHFLYRTAFSLHPSLRDHICHFDHNHYQMIVKDLPLSLSILHLSYKIFSVESYNFFNRKG